MSSATLRIWPALPKSVIHPNIYGHFAEHLGRCIYEGLWTGKGRRIPNDDGLRIDVIAALKQLRAPVLRWPGGCFADDYHWRDGVGPAAERPVRANLWWRQAEPNEFGTDEFMRLCEGVGCAPYLCCNVGSGSPEEAKGWLEYCNFGGDTSLTRLRAANGRRTPYNVQYWGIGNENWGCGGRLRPEDYAGAYARFAAYLHHFDPRVELIASGTSFFDYKNPILNTWNHTFCEHQPHADLIDHLSIHRYFTRGTGDAFNDGEFRALFSDLHTMQRDLELTEAVLRYFYPEKCVGIAVDEWGMWHPAATVENGLEQPNTLRDAVFAGALLNLFNRWAHRVTMANLAQTVNVLQCLAVTEGARMYLTPTYYVFDMMRPHMGARLLTHEVECCSYEAHPLGLRTLHPVPALDMSASISGRRVLLTVANTTPDQDIDACIEVREAQAGSVSGKVLTAAQPNAVNDFEEPRRVVSRRLKLEAAGGTFEHVFPRHSFTSIAITLA